MSNIGKPLRQLMLEQRYGRPPMDAQMRLKMTYGHLTEALVMLLVKASGLAYTSQIPLSLEIPYDRTKTVVKGTLDIKIDGQIYDIKSASSWSFDNKFVNFAELQADDPFGYVGQGFGYSLGDKSDFAGWIVVDKSDGRIKVVDLSDKERQEGLAKYSVEFSKKLSALNNPKAELPPCEGVVDETFYQKKTGNKHLNKSCEFCTHKYKCHPTLKYAVDKVSKAKSRKFKYYVN